MKIIAEFESAWVNFHSIKERDVFLYDTQYYMKIKKINNWNAINLETTVLSIFPEYNQVLKVDAELNIKGLVI